MKQRIRKILVKKAYVYRKAAEAMKAHYQHGACLVLSDTMHATGKMLGGERHHLMQFFIDMMGPTRADVAGMRSALGCEPTNFDFQWYAPAFWLAFSAEYDHTGNRYWKQLSTKEVYNRRIFALLFMYEMARDLR